MQNISERLQFLITSRKETPNSFAKEIDVNTTVIYNILKGKNKPSADFIEVLHERIHVNPNWLLLGLGDIYLSDSQQGIENTQNNYNISANSNKNAIDKFSSSVTLKFADKNFKAGVLVDRKLRNELKDKLPDDYAMLERIKKITTQSEILNEVVDRYIKLKFDAGEVFNYIPSSLSSNDFYQQPPDYNDYKENIIRHLSPLKHYSADIEAISNAIEVFLKRIKPLDIDFVIENEWLFS